MQWTVRNILVPVCLTISLPAIAQEYHVDPLGMPPGAISSIPWGINNSGTIVGEYVDLGGTTRAFLWTEATGMSEIPAPAGHAASAARDVNDTGFVIGNSLINLADTVGHGWYWNGGVTTLIPKPLTYLHSNAAGLNNTQVVCGDIYKSSIAQVFGFFWSPAKGMQIVGAQYTHVRDINDSGQMVGYKPASGAMHTLRWNANGSSIDVVATDGFVHCYGNTINEAGQFAGRMTSVSGDNVGLFRYTDGVGMESLGGSGPVGEAWDINASGDVVGVANLVPGVGQANAVVYTDADGLRSLGGLLDDTGWVLLTATAIADDGTVVAAGTKNGGPVQAVRLVPIEVPPPDPCTGNEWLRAKCVVSPCGNRIDIYVTHAVPSLGPELLLDGAPMTFPSTDAMGAGFAQLCGATSGQHEVKWPTCGVRTRVLCP